MRALLLQLLELRHAELKPQGLLETKLVQTIADTYWRLDRIRASRRLLLS
jgi:hypothetical protein